MAIRAMREENSEIYAASPVLRFVVAVKEIPAAISYEARIESLLDLYHAARVAVNKNTPNEYDKLRCSFISFVGKFFIPPQLSIHSPEYRIYCVALEAHREIIGQYGAHEYEHNINGIRNAEDTIDKINVLIERTLPGACPDPDGPSPRHNSLRRPA